MSSVTHGSRNNKHQTAINKHILDCMTIGSIETSMVKCHSEFSIFGEFGVFHDGDSSTAELVSQGRSSELTGPLPKGEVCRPWSRRIVEQSLPPSIDMLLESAWFCWAEIDLPLRVAQKTKTGFPAAYLCRTGQSSLSRRLFKTHSLDTSKPMICLTSLTGRYSSPNCDMSAGARDQ